MDKSSHQLKASKSGVEASKINLKSKSKAKLKSRIFLEPETKISVNDSNDPSYTNLVLPYRVVCRHRYHRSGLQQRAQFVREVKAHELLQTVALDGLRIHRVFCNGVLSPPTADEVIKLTREQQMKVEEILRTELKF